MSFTRKIVDGARSGLSSLLEKVATDDTPLSHIDEQELDAELAARVEVRKQSTTRPMDNPRAKHAGASAAAVAYRQKQAAERSARVNARRARQREAKERASREAYKQAQQSQQRRSSSARTGSASGASGPRASGSNRARSRRGEPSLADHLKTLNLPPTATLTEAKRSFRQLMRKYHPDLAPESKKKAATELTMRITAAYKAVEEHFSGK